MPEERVPRKWTEENKEKLLKAVFAGDCIACGNLLGIKGGYGGTGMCGLCATGEADALEEFGETW